MLHTINKLKYLLGLETKFSRHLRREKKRWVQDDGDHTLRLKYPLDNHSVVFDIGGYKGQWASDIFSMYRCNIKIFEPIPEYAEYIKKRFFQNDLIELIPAGLGESDKDATIYIQNDRTSTFGKEGKKITIKVKDVCAAMDETKTFEIDLVKVNIEGGEYELLERLLNSGYIKRVKNLQVQFHTFVPEAKIRISEIRSRLSHTHKLTYKYDFVWENWELKTNDNI